MDAASKLVMLTKYIERSHAPKLMAALELWEQAAEQIHAREDLMTRFKAFELSRPYDLVSPRSEKRDEDERNRYVNQLRVATDSLRELLLQLLLRFDDRVIFRGRDYRERMRGGARTTEERATILVHD